MTTKKCSDIPIEEIEYYQPKQNTYGGSMIGVFHNKSKIVMQIPKSKVPFGVNSLTTDKNEVKKSIDISFYGMENNPSQREFRKWIEDLDEKHKETAIARSELWFKKKHSASVITELYKPLLNDKSKTYPATIRFKIPTDEYGNFTGDVYDSLSKQRISLDDIKKGCYVSLIVEAQPMWFLSKQFGMTFKVQSIKVFQPQVQHSEYAFRDDDE